LIDLHTHTTASDGRCTPAQLVERAAAAGVTVLGVSDHDTVAACEEVSAACASAGIEFVPGIEITAVAEDADVHVLGYFIERGSPALAAFLDEQRNRRLDRVREMIARLTERGMRLDADRILQPALTDPSRSAGRPWIARALVQAGYVGTANQAFELWLGRGRPAFVARTGVSPEEVFRRIHEAQGIASLAHPILVGHDEWIPGFADARLDALEAYHSDHDEATTARYVELARRHGLAVSGGSDYHGDGHHGAGGPGSVSLPREEYERLLVRRR
jgi:predicted metal-dependent phosphoesterase TrpH